MQKGGYPLHSGCVITTLWEERVRNGAWRAQGAMSRPPTAETDVRFTARSRTAIT